MTRRPPRSPLFPYTTLSRSTPGANPPGLLSVAVGPPVHDPSALSGAPPATTTAAGGTVAYSYSQDPTCVADGTAAGTGTVTANSVTDSSGVKIGRASCRERV